eukprot:TRINITY_DN1511_c0_g1::TRINITY_DN1511_c0_g1_i1::g.28182::m.28182 TRINITY_DN1511_c0_g1::TRINITY_DN1511_c0_g1_i1::g.28182  ORF type:complete len:327 (-),score=64.86 TRINITY_DN1511_c0_g1_i1:27-974(-)
MRWIHLFLVLASCLSTLVYCQNQEQAPTFLWSQQPDFFLGGKGFETVSQLRYTEIERIVLRFVDFERYGEREGLSLISKESAVADRIVVFSVPIRLSDDTDYTSLFTSLAENTVSSRAIVKTDLPPKRRAWIPLPSISSLYPGQIIDGPLDDLENLLRSKQKVVVVHGAKVANVQEGVRRVTQLLSGQSFMGVVAFSPVSVDQAGQPIGRKLMQGEIQTTACNSDTGVCYFHACDPATDANCYDDAEGCYSDGSSACFEAQVDHPVHLNSDMLAMLLLSLSLLYIFLQGLWCVWSLQTPQRYETEGQPAAHKKNQ